MTTCNNYQCEHNEAGMCKLKDRSIVDCVCVSRRKIEPEEDYKSLMRQSDPKGHRRRGKWVSN
jgi:hypothetical protein